MAKNQRSIKILVIVLFLVALGISAFSFYLAGRNVPLGKDIFKVKFSVTNERLIGIFADKLKDTVNFGKLPRKSTTSKTISITNRFDRDLMLKVIVGDSIKDFVSCPESVELKKGKTVDIPVSLNVGLADEGDYEGELSVIYYSK